MTEFSVPRAPTEEAAASPPGQRDEGAEVVSPALLAFRHLEACKAEWQAAAGKARKKLWTLLAAIFVAHELFNERDDSREFFVERVKNMPDYSKGELDPTTHSLLDLMVIYSTGFERDTASSRCQYTAALRAAIGNPHLQRTEGAFLAWLKRKGGIIAAGASNRSPHEPVVRFSFPVFKHYLASMARRGTIEFAVHPETEVVDGLTVILASYDPDHPGELQVVDAVADEGVIQRVSQLIATNRAKKLPDEARQALLLEQHLWELNRITLKLAKKNSRVTWKDADRWAGAHLALHDGDRKERKLFSGEYHRSEFVDPSGTDSLELPVAHPDYHQLDPGRYIKTARKGALMPYDPSDQKAVDQYINKHINPYVYAKPIELTDFDAPEVVVEGGDDGPTAGAGEEGAS